MADALTLSFPEPDVALITFDLPGKGANILSLSVLEELRGLLDQLQPRSELAGLVIKSGKPGTFIAGADIREFLASLGAPKSEVVAMCRRQPWRRSTASALAVERNWLCGVIGA
jgi:enoyl-CoA hydratase/carnithine racemase